jgi:hypothetical protein
MLSSGFEASSFYKFIELLICFILFLISLAAAGDIADGRNGDVADDHYHRYMVQNQETSNPWSLISM